MDRLMYVAMTGAKQTMFANAINNNNLANVNSTGFRADLATFQSQPIQGAGFESRINSVIEKQDVDFTTGPVMSTGRDLDVAVQGQGWIAVQASDGKEAYTRAGDLSLNSVGMLITKAGDPVLGNSGPIAIPPYEKLTIGGDGTLSILPVGQAATTMVVLDRIKLVNPDVTQLQKTKEGLMRHREGSPQAANASVSIMSGALEGSNVNSVSALVNMIELSRHHEMQVKMIKTAEENDKTTTQLMRIG